MYDNKKRSSLHIIFSLICDRSWGRSSTFTLLKKIWYVTGYLNKIFFTSTRRPNKFSKNTKTPRDFFLVTDLTRLENLPRLPPKNFVTNSKAKTHRPTKQDPEKKEIYSIRNQNKRTTNGKCAKHAAISRGVVGRKIYSHKAGGRKLTTTPPSSTSKHPTNPNSRCKEQYSREDIDFQGEFLWGGEAPAPATHVPHPDLTYPYTHPWYGEGRCDRRRTGGMMMEYA